MRPRPRDSRAGSPVNCHNPPAGYLIVNILPFDRSLYQQRLALVQNELQAKDLSALLLFNPENIYWLTGYQTIGYFTFQTLLVGADGLPEIVGRIVNRDLALAHDTIGDFIAVHDTDDPMDILSSRLVSTIPGGSTIGLETTATNFSISDYQQLLGKVNFRMAPCDGLIEPHRIIKSDEEIKRLQHAARCAEDGLSAAINAIAPGKTENDIAAAMFHGAISRGSEYLGHPPLVVAGETTSLCFAMWRRREIRSGDVVLLESAGCIDRYHSILSRPVVVGKPTRSHLETAGALQGVLESAIESIKPGMTSGEVDRACRKVVEAKGLGNYFRHRSAYGIGIGFPPNWSEGHIYAIRPDDSLVLKENMTFHVIPTLFLQGFGMCFSDSIRITNDGCELLTDFERKLFIVD